MLNKLRNMALTTIIVGTLANCSVTTTRTTTETRIRGNERTEAIADSLYKAHNLERFPGLELIVKNERRGHLAANLHSPSNKLYVYLGGVEDGARILGISFAENLGRVMIHEETHLEDRATTRENNSALFDILYTIPSSQYLAQLDAIDKFPDKQLETTAGINEFIKKHPEQTKTYVVTKAIIEGIASYQEDTTFQPYELWQPKNISELNNHRQVNRFAYENGHALVYPILKLHGERGRKHLLKNPPTTNDFNNLIGYQKRILKELGPQTEPFTLEDIALDVRTPTQILRLHPDTTLVAKKTLAQATKELAALTILHDEEDIWMYIPATNEWHDIGYKDPTAPPLPGARISTEMKSLTMKRRTKEKEITLCHIHPAEPHSTPKGHWTSTHFISAIPSHYDIKTHFRLSHLYESYKTIQSCLVNQFGTFTYSQTTQQENEFEHHEPSFIYEEIEETLESIHQTLPGRIAAIYNQPYFKEALNRRARSISNSYQQATGKKPTTQQNIEIIALSAGITALTYLEMPDTYITLTFEPHTPETLQYLIQLKTGEQQ